MTARPATGRSGAARARSRSGDRHSPSGDRHSPSGDRQQRRDDRRQQLVEAAVRVVRREGPDASMDRFAAEAGVTKPILYRVFGDRAGLHQAVGEHAFAALGAELQRALERVDVTPRAMVASAIDAYLGFIEREPALYAFLTTVADRGTRRQTVDVYAARATSQVAQILGEALRGLGGDSGAAEPWAYGMVGMVVWAGGWWLERRTMPRKRLVAYLTDLVCDGLPGIAPDGATVADLLSAERGPTT